MRRKCNAAHLHFSNFTRSERDISWRATKKNISGKSVHGAFTTTRNMDEYFFTEVKPFSSPSTRESRVAICASETRIARVKRKQKKKKRKLNNPALGPLGAR